MVWVSVFFVRRFSFLLLFFWGCFKRGFCVAKCERMKEEGSMKCEKDGEEANNILLPV